MSGTPVFGTNAGEHFDPPSEAELEQLAACIAGPAPTRTGELRELLAIADPTGAPALEEAELEDLADFLNTDDRGELYGLGFVCRSCGCTDNRACPGGCDWAEPNLCTACAPRVQTARSAAWRGFGLGLIVGLPGGFWLAIVVFGYLLARASHG